MDYKQIKKLKDFQAYRVKYRGALPGNMLHEEDKAILKILQKMERDNRPVELNIEFNAFYELFGLKVDKIDAEAAWRRLNDQERTQAMLHAPKYRDSLKVTGFHQVSPARYLKKKKFNDEIRVDPVKADTKPQRQTEWI